MQLPIPDDWDNQTWRCVEIEWPDSPYWIALLHGALSLYSRGRYWDARTGSIKFAQAIGSEIFYRNTPLKPCGAGVEPPPEQGEDYPQLVERIIAGMIGPEGCEKMGGCWIPRGALKIEGGDLWARDICGEWYKIGAIADASAPVDENPWDDGETEFYPCGKLWSLLDVMWAIGNAAWGAKGDVPWSWVGTVKASAPGYSLESGKIAGIVIQASVLDATYGESEVFDELLWQNVACQAVSLLDGTSQGMSQDQFSSFKGILRGVFSAAGREQAGSWWENVVDCLGYTDANAAAVYGSVDNTRDCSCPDAPFAPPGDSDWVYDFDFELGTHNWEPAAEDTYVAGVGWQGSTNWFNGSVNKINSDTPHDTDGLSGVITFLQVHYELAQRGDEASPDGFYFRLDSSSFYKPVSGEQIFNGFPVITWVGTQPWAGALTLDGNLYLNYGEKNTGANPIILKRVIIAGTGDPFVAAPIAY